MAGVCGRACGTCGFREQYGCRGCLETEGNPVWGTCRVVQCCHGRGLQNCGECPSQASCGAAAEMDGRREQWPEEAAERLRREADRNARFRAELGQKAPVLARWLLVLFWTSVCSGILSALNELGVSGGTATVIACLNVVVGLLALAAFWKLSPLSPRFRTVWLLVLTEEIAAVVVVLLALGGSALTVVALPLTLGIAVLSLVQLYQSCEAIAEQLEESDLPEGSAGFTAWNTTGSRGRYLAGNWRLLRKWMLGSLAALVGCVVLAFVIVGLALILALMAALVLLGSAIAECVLLWQSARFFRDAAEALALPAPEI